MSTAAAASGLDEETAQHWLDVLSENGIDASLVPSAKGLDVMVADGSLAAAQALFADPFADDADSGADDDVALPPIAEVAPLAPDERTEVLARTPDLIAAQRLVDILTAEGLYARLDAGASSSTFGFDGLPTATVVVAERQRDQAFARLEAFARQHTGIFEGAARIDPAEVIEALLLAPLGLLRIRSNDKR